MEETIQKYYALKEYAERKTILDRIDDPRIKEVFHKRYKKELDQFMYAWVMIVGLKNEMDKIIFKNSRKKDFTEYMNMLGMNETIDEVWIKEWKHFLMSYFQISTNSKEYASKFFGIGSLKEEQVYTKLTNEIKLVTQKIPAFYGYENECEKLNQVANETLEEFKELKRKQSEVSWTI